jgi:hypothetical protein
MGFDQYHEPPEEMSAGSRTFARMMDLEFLLRRTPKWRAAMEKVLFTDGDIVEEGEEAEEAADEA